MTFKEAAELARQGVKITHEYFSDNEYMTMQGNIIIFEDGATIFGDEWLKDKDWVHDGWSEWEGKLLPSRTGINTNEPISYVLNNYRAVIQEKSFKCKGKHRYELITNGKWACTCGKQLNS